MNKQYLAETRREIDAWPDVSLSQDNAGKHGRIVLHYKDESRFVVVSNTPSDALGIKNHIALVRRILKGMGANRTKPQVSQIERVRNKQVRVDLRDVVAPVRENPFLKLEKPIMATNSNNTIDAIFSSIERLRYSEMLELATILSETATARKLRRSRPNDWAQMLQSAAEANREPAL